MLKAFYFAFLRYNFFMRKFEKRIISFLITFLLIVSGVYYFGLNYVPKEFYETQVMQPGQNEAYYVEKWCSPKFGRREAVLWDLTRVDCLTKDYAIEFDFAKKWAESVGQSLYYAKMTNRLPAVAIILTKWSDMIYVKRIERLNNGIKIFLIKAF